MSPIPPRWPHQEEAFRFVRGLWSRQQNGAMLALAMGLGKSRVAAELAVDDGVKEMLVACPLRVVPTWEQQFARYAPGYFHVLALDDRAGYTVERKHKEAMRILSWGRERHKPVAIVINYDAARLAPFGSWAANRLWDMVIADELHRAKEPQGRTSLWLAKVGLMARRRLGLTGTPMPHLPIDFWAQFRFLNPFHLDRSYWRFKNEYAIMGGYFNKEIVGWRNLDGLRARFKELAFQVDESVLALPAVLDETRTTVMGKEGARIYGEMEREMIAWIGTQQATAANALVRLLRLAQITGGALEDEGGTRHQIDTAKEDLLCELLMDLREPVVVFCRFRADLEAVHRASAKAGLASMELSGSKDELRAWQLASDPVVLAVQIQSGGVGVDLTRARVAIYYSLDFSLANYLQSRKRIHRPPQSRPCVFYHLVVADSIDAYILRAIEARRDLIDSVLGEGDLAGPVLEQLKKKGAQHVVTS
ncbi:MAG TPA: DEAD/DEAH box helicase [Acetobacteraceae bacterium]|jgi:SNF2 family DNA or RNA helicase|nr:DEAD/DEAH box helicase [Acetobacteraceae bacterium]